MDMACQEEDVYKNPALFSALLKYIASERYGRIIEVSFITRIRSTQKFSSIDALANQMKLDAKQIRTILKNNKN